MKPFFLFLMTLTVLLQSCEKNDGGRLDPEATLAINAPKETKANEDTPFEERWTPLEIVKGTSAIQTKMGCMGIPDVSRDTVNQRIVLMSFNIIDSRGALVDLFIGSRDVVFEHWVNEGTPEFDPYNIIRDTIAYIPNAVLGKAQQEIEAAYQAEDYATCYKLFEEAYTFYPITGAEWRALKEAGKQ